MTNRTKLSHCRGCFALIDASTGIDTERGPKENDYSICFYCGSISTFDKDLNLIPLTPEEIVTLRNTDPKNWSMLNLAAKYIHERINKN